MDKTVVSRRGFMGLTAVGAVAAGLGLAGCNAGGADAGAGAPAAQPSGGVPATTPADQLPIPEKGQVCINEQPRDNIQDGGTLTLPILEIGPDWNGVSVTGNTTYMHELSSYVSPNLFLYNATASECTPNPDYLESFEVSEETGKQVVTITMSPKAVFNDGTPIDYNAFKTAWMACNGSDERFTPAATDCVELIESVEKGAGDRDVVITFQTPVYPPQSAIFVLHPANQDPEVFNKGWLNNPHNEWQAGPFVVDSWDDTQATFKPNPQWWGDAPKLDTVIYRQMESQASINAFKNGEVDAAAGNTLESLRNFETMEDAEIRRAYAQSIACYEINTTRGVFQDIAVRKAFCQCFDPQVENQIVYQGVNWKEERPGSIIINTWADGYENNLPEEIQKLDQGSTEDRAKAARTTLEDAGYTLDGDYYAKDGVPVAFTYVTFGDSATFKNVDAAIQKMCKDAGIKMEIDNHASSEFSTVVAGGDFDMIGIAWGGSTAGYDFGYQLYGSDSPSNVTHAGSKELDDKFNSVLGISDHKKQLEVCNEAEKEALELYAVIPSRTGPATSVVKKGLANYGPSLFLTIRPEDIGWQKED